MAAGIIQYLQVLTKQKGSDLHVAAHSSPMIRVHGDLIKIDVPPLDGPTVDKMLGEILTATQRTDLQAQRQIDFAIKVTGLGNFRVNIFYQRQGLSAVLRALPEQPPTLEQLNLPVICKTVCSYPHGLVLVTGPTGSGKSTTLAAMVNHINQTMRGHILTLEDPVEFVHESKRCMVNQRELGTNFKTFAAALRASLREDPDVILVGELRDPETMALAITAAETGHLVFATVHTNTAAKSVDRILDSFTPEQQPQIRSMLSESLRAVITQKLIPTADGKGRVCVHDILINTPAVANLIREGKIFQLGSVMQTSRKEGMQVIDQALLDMVRAGTVAGPTAWEYANDKALFAQWVPKEPLSVTGVGTHTRAPGTVVPPRVPSGLTGLNQMPTGLTNPNKKTG